ncbi:MAG: chemotaxis-specific protein-glutamate methyltransferase CheB [Gammaproteobacteria bacterium SHHR-1]|uniref:chemotaxis-specific protein-glutamate methyltransferase CheB n=1 Tax=Magnetovirga frankeli TaxID=947516 RepID=UPI0012937713|nr:chemotaxis-specific protein-glutamate methyltransferase CheB [gamma proteobacterium SS-5]
MAQVRVLIVDDSALLRDIVRDLLSQDARIQVVGEAENGAQALEQARALRPDVITMDLQMPVMGGIEAISAIMAEVPTPILVLSSIADASNACEAIARGALEAMDKSPASLSSQLCRKLRMLAGVTVIRHYRKRGQADPQPAAAGLDHAHTHPRHVGAAFFIASSTGGPQVLAELLQLLPADFPCPILIAQHIADGFAGGMAEWFDGICPLPVRLAEQGQPIRPGEVLISPSERHLGLDQRRCVRLLEPAEGDIYHPSCDQLLISAAQVYGKQAVGLILTGMGRDGVQGMGQIKAVGGATLAQDEASSVIFGMNRLAIEAGCIDQVLAPVQLAEEMQWLAVTRQ